MFSSGELIGELLFRTTGGVIDMFCNSSPVNGALSHETQQHLIVVHRDLSINIKQPDSPAPMIPMAVKTKVELYDSDIFFL
tara:strand:+ start:184 stop:426 length:243 start_codon:yes stop_codon:yes gene_type:complete